MATANLKHVPIIIDMSDDMARFAHETALKAFETCTKEREIASFIQTEFNKAFGIEGSTKSVWCVAVGRSFGASVTHEAKRYCHFQIGSLTIVIWKSGA